MERKKLELKWILITFLILYRLTAMTSMGLLIGLNVVRSIITWLPPIFSLSNWLSHIKFLLIFSATLTTISTIKVKRRKDIDDYLRET